MNIYVQIEDQTVVQTALAESINVLSGEWADVTNIVPLPEMGWRYIDDAWLEPLPEPKDPVITTVDFVELFTPAEFMAVEALMGVDAITTQLYKVAELQGTVDMSSPKVTEIALPNFVTLGVLTQERADEISNSWQNDEEP